MREYEHASREHDLDRVLACIGPGAIYWFSNETCYAGKPAVAQAIRNNFQLIKAEVYRIEGLTWLVHTEQVAVCIYRYVWEGVISGERMSGSGRGTSVLERRDSQWYIVHEHLSKGPIE